MSDFEARIRRLKGEWLIFIINQLINVLNKDNIPEKYIATQINCPSSQRSIELMKELKDRKDFLIEKNTKIEYRQYISLSKIILNIDNCMQY